MKIVFAYSINWGFFSGSRKKILVVISIVGIIWVNL